MEYQTSLGSPSDQSDKNLSHHQSRTSFLIEDILYRQKANQERISGNAGSQDHMGVHQRISPFKVPVQNRLEHSESIGKRALLSHV